MANTLLTTQWSIGGLRGKCVDYIWEQWSIFCDECLLSSVPRLWWTPWYLCAVSCVQCPAQPQRDSAHLSPLSPNKSPSLALPSATLWWKEQLKISTEPWSKKKTFQTLQVRSRSSEKTLTSYYLLFFREVKLSVVSYLTNSIMDQILQELYTTHKTLVLVISPYCMASL